VEVALVEEPAFAEGVVETASDDIEEVGEDDVALGFACCVVPSLMKTPRPSLQQVEPSVPAPEGPQQ